MEKMMFTIRTFYKKKDSFYYYQMVSELNIIIKKITSQLIFFNIAITSNYLALATLGRRQLRVILSGNLNSFLKLR